MTAQRLPATTGDAEAVVGVQDALEIAGGYEHVSIRLPVRARVACPAMDGGSAWFTNRKGVSPHVGMVSVEITPDAPYWRAPVLHTA